jgi:hypothetical protein
LIKLLYIPASHSPPPYFLHLGIPFTPFVLEHLELGGPHLHTPSSPYSSSYLPGQASLLLCCLCCFSSNTQHQTTLLHGLSICSWSTCCNHFMFLTLLDVWHPCSATAPCGFSPKPEREGFHSPCWSVLIQRLFPTHGMDALLSVRVHLDFQLDWMKDC